MIEFARPDEAPDLQIYRETMECASAYLGMEAHHEGYQTYPFPQRLYALSEISRAHVLREYGDIKRFLKIENRMNTLKLSNGQPARQPSEHDKTIFTMMEWLDKEIDSIKIYKSSRNKAVISLMVWGEKYTEKAVNCLLKCFMAEGNMDVLSEWKQVIFHIQTTKASRDILNTSLVVEKMKRLGVHFEYAILPDELVKNIDNNSVYWMVGTGSTLGLLYAKRNNAAFHLAFPDIVYSNNYFAEIKRLSEDHEAILANGPRADESLLRPMLCNYEDSDRISIPSGDLVGLAVNCIHMSQHLLQVNNRPQMWLYPQTHFLMWESPVAMHYNCPHLDPIWLSAEITANVKERFYMSMDSEMDLICKGNDFYIPQINDKMFKVEISEQSKHGVADKYVDATNFAVHMWAAITHRDTLKFFSRGMVTALNRDVRPASPRVISEPQIGAEMAYLMNELMARDPYKGVKLARERSHEGMIYRAA